VIGRAVGEVPPVFGRHPAWRATAPYARLDRVTLGPYVYEARRANRGVRPEPAPEQPSRATWVVVGTRAVPSPARGGAGGAARQPPRRPEAASQRISDSGVMRRQPGARLFDSCTTTTHHASEPRWTA
jgi:hypothetical protein